MEIKKIFSGESGQWLARDCVPPYAVAFFIWPALALFTPDTSWLRSFFVTFSAGDFFAIALCLIFPALFAKDHANDHYVGVELIITIVACTMFYWGVKIAPPKIPESNSVISFLQEASVKLYFVIFASWGCAIRSTTLLYRLKARSAE